MNSKAEVPIHCAQTPFTGRIADTVQEKHSMPPAKGNTLSRFTRNQAEAPIDRAQTGFIRRRTDQHSPKRKISPEKGLESSKHRLTIPSYKPFSTDEGHFELRMNLGNTLPINGVCAR